MNLPPKNCPVAHQSYGQVCAPKGFFTDSGFDHEGFRCSPSCPAVAGLLLEHLNFRDGWRTAAKIADPDSRELRERPEMLVRQVSASVRPCVRALVRRFMCVACACGGACTYRLSKLHIRTTLTTWFRVLTTWFCVLLVYLKEIVCTRNLSSFRAKSCSC